MKRPTCWSSAMIRIEICIDVPDLERGICFYAEAFGFAFCADPFGNGFCLLENKAK
jgi:hypothetical protein